MDTRDYVADRREYDGRGRRVRHSGGWAILRWDKSRSTWLEPVSYYPTKGAALDVLRDERERSKAASALGRRGGLAGRGESQRRPGMTSEHMRAVRAARTYEVSIRYSSGEITMPTALASLAAAKETARVAWDAKPGMCVIIRSGARSWEAAQVHGSGMLWR